MDSNRVRRRGSLEDHRKRMHELLSSFDKKFPLNLADAADTSSSGSISYNNIVQAISGLRHSNSRSQMDAVSASNSSVKNDSPVRSVISLSKSDVPFSLPQRTLMANDVEFLVKKYKDPKTLPKRFDKNRHLIQAPYHRDDEVIPETEDRRTDSPILLTGKQRRHLFRPQANRDIIKVLYADGSDKDEQSINRQREAQVVTDALTVIPSQASKPKSDCDMETNRSLRLMLERNHNSSDISRPVRRKRSLSLDDSRRSRETIQNRQVIHPSSACPNTTAILMPRKRFFRGNKLPVVQMPLEIHSSGELNSAQSALALQLNGNMAALQRVFSHHDPTRSGKLNREEFKKSLFHAGIILSDSMVSTIFNQYADPIPNDHGIIGYTAGHALNIKKFSEQMLDRASSKMFQHVIGTKTADALKSADERRVLRNIARATDKLSDSLLIYKHLNPDHNGLVTKEKLRDGLTRSGAVLDNREFDILMKEVPISADGLIDMKHFQTKIHTNLQQFDQSTYLERKKALEQNHRYSNTYKSADILQQSIQCNFATSRDSQTGRSESMKLSKLKSMLQSNCSKVLNCYTSAVHSALYSPLAIEASNGSNGVGFAVDHIMHLSELTQRLAGFGIPIVAEDRQMLRVLLRNYSSSDANIPQTATQPADGVSSDPAISLQNLCGALNIPIQTRPDGSIELKDPKLSDSDGGTFRSSAHSAMSHSTFATSFHCNGNENAFMGSHRRAQSRPKFAHETPNQTAKFWALEQSIGTPDLMPSPLPSFRETKYNIPVGTRRMLSPNVESCFDSPTNNSHRHHFGRRRSISAPATSRNGSVKSVIQSSQSNDDGRSVEQKSHLNNNSDQVASRIQQQGSVLSSSLSKWANRSLSDFIASTIDPNAKTIADAQAQSKKTSLRRIVNTQQSVAPFALDL